MKRILSFAISFVMVATITTLPAGVFAVEGDAPSKEIMDAGEATFAESPTGQGGIINFEDRDIRLKGDPADVSSGDSKLSRIRAAIDDAKYDPRDPSTGAPFYDAIQVRDQAHSGLCWAFSATTAAQIDYNNDLAKNGGKFTTPLSPAHLGYFLYNRFNDPLGNTAGDQNIIVNPGAGNDYADAGGSPIMTIQALANWDGLALETDEYKTAYSTLSKEWAPEFDVGKAFDKEIILESAELLDSASDVKAAILENGSVAVSYYADDDDVYYNGYKIDNVPTAAYYCYDKKDSNHGVTIVGWDDDYPKSNFGIRNEDGTLKTGAKQPSADGAWIVQNSWGEDWGDGGYFYLSYEDKSIVNFTSYDVNHASAYDYNYQYDGNANPDTVEYYKNEKAANVFTVPEESKGHVLDKIRFTTWNEGVTNYTVSVYTGVTNPDNPTGGTLACSFDVQTDNAGCYAFDTVKDGIVTPIALEPGSMYSIVLTLKETVWLGVEADYNYGWVKFSSSFAKDQSYWYSPSTKKWYDCADEKFCNRIKGYATAAEGAIEPDSITINGQNTSGVITRAYGDDDPLTVDFGSDAVTEKHITWSSSNPAVATVGKDGSLSMKAVGKTTITALSVNGKMDTAVLSVTAPKVTISSASANLYGYDDVKFTWKPADTNSIVPTSYDVYYRKSTTTSWTKAGTVTGTTTSKNIANLADGGKYYFRIQPYVKIGSKTYKGTYKNSAALYTLKKVNKPTAKKKSRNYITVKWKNIPGETGYQIARSKYSNKSFSVVKTVKGESVSSVKLKTTRKKTYYYKVRAYKTVNGKKIYGPWSAVRSYKLK